MKTPWPEPEVIGCTRCGDEVLPVYASWVQCSGCGKVCGLCESCARALGWRFVRDAMAFHRKHKHPDLGLPADIRQELVRVERGRRRWGERFEI